LVQLTRGRRHVSAQQRQLRIGHAMSHDALALTPFLRSLLALAFGLLNLGLQLRGFLIVRIQRQGIVTRSGCPLEIAACQRRASRIAMNSDLPGTTLE
jgi:hypothetical protein